MISTRQPCGGDGIMMFQRDPPNLDKEQAIMIQCDHCPERQTTQGVCEYWYVWITWYKERCEKEMQES